MNERYGHGLVVGKFYPPHAGHDHLIAAAAAHCDRVTVVVAGSSVESIPVADRVTWLSATHAGTPHVTVVGDLDDGPVDYDSADAWVQHTAVFAAVAARATIEAGLPSRAAAIDVVFSSEKYGAELARRLGARNVVVDHARHTFPVSGTEVRSDLPQMWDYLAPSVRAGLAQRVVVLGAESTGTTTLSRDLTAALRARGGMWGATGWVGEFGRDYSAAKLETLRWQAKQASAPAPDIFDLVWTPGDFVTIARRQRELEDGAATSGPLLVCDTDAFATSVWLRRYLGTGTDVAPWRAQVQAIADSRRHPLYLLTDHVGVEFEQDGTRDGESIREQMTTWFADELTATRRNWVRIRGTREQRTSAALAAIDTLIETAWRFNDPLESKGSN